MVKKIQDSIKERLGYDPGMPDRDFLKDWKRRAPVFANHVLCSTSLSSRGWLGDCGA